MQWLDYVPSVDLSRAAYVTNHIAASSSWYESVEALFPDLGEIGQEYLAVRDVPKLCATSIVVILFEIPIRR